MCFFRMVAAVVVGIAVFFLIVGCIAYVKWGEPPRVVKGSILVVSLEGAFPEYPPGGYTSGLLAEAYPTLHGVLDDLTKASVDKRIKGVLLVLDRPAAGYAALEEVRAGIQKVRAAGKPVWSWSDNVDLKSLYVASACDSFFVHPTGYCFVGGMYVERLYVAGTLEKLGIEPQIARMESYKSAVEMFTRKDMSPADREMEGWLLSDLYPRVLDDIAKGFGADARAVESVMERAVMPSADLVPLSLATGVREWDEMKGALPRPKRADEPALLAAADYDRVPAEKVGLKGKKKIAVVHAQGMIAGDESGSDPLLGTIMGYKSVNQDLKAALDDDDVAGVILRVDSRGGESITSDRISRMVEVVNKKKPVVVSMVDVAASGGYNIAYRARTILADGNTITGSIGEFTGKFSARDFYNKLGITKDGAGLGPSGDFYSDYRPWTPAEFGKVAANNRNAYNTWIQNIARFRKLDVAQVDSVGRGRVWTGRQALDRKLIDGLGNLDAAVLAVKRAAGIDSTEKVTLDHYPKPEGLLATLLGMNPTGLPGVLAQRWIEERRKSWSDLNRGTLQLMDLPIP
jgi:protease IV